MNFCRIFFGAKQHRPKETREQQLKGENSTLQEEVRGVSKCGFFHWEDDGSEIPKQPPGMVKTL